MSMANFGDGAAAVILEKVEEEVKRGFIDSMYYTDADHHDMAEMPKCGFSKIYSEEIPAIDKKSSIPISHLSAQVSLI
jgi:3-oxoacyl-[acyl-carrier-protein] synthase-3